MARPTPDANFGSQFNAARFRSAIRNVMTMGLPNSTAEQATFRWTPVRTFDPESPAHDPYGWTQTATSTTTHADVIVPVAVELSSRPTGSVETSLGEFDVTWAKLTVLDTDFAFVDGADQVILGGGTYEIQFVEPPQGLFEVTIYTVHARARDEA